MSKWVDLGPGQLEIGHERGQVIIKHPELDTDEFGEGQIIFTPAQARHLATLIFRQAEAAEKEIPPTNGASTNLRHAHAAVISRQNNRLRPRD